jgi:hypothetical protein
VQRLPDRLIHHLGVQAQQGTQARHHRRAQVRDVIDLVLVQADALDQVHLDLVGRRDRPHQVGAGPAGVLGHG